MENNILMNKEKYYKPNREDFFIGYEYEYEANNPYNPEDNWTKAKFSLREAGEFDEGFMIDWYLEKDKVRVPYLTKEQIEAEGWIHKQYVKDSQLVFNFVKNDWYLEFWVGKIPYIEIGREGYDTGYTGNCKSINELKKLQNWLGIK